MQAVLTSRSVKRIQDFIKRECSCSQCEVTIDIHRDFDYLYGVEPREVIIQPMESVGITIRFNVSRFELSEEC